MSNEKWKCPKCGVENDAENAFCGDCGTKRPEREIGIAIAGKVVQKQVNQDMNSSQDVIEKGESVKDEKVKKVVDDFFKKNDSVEDTDPGNKENKMANGNGIITAIEDIQKKVDSKIGVKGKRIIVIILTIILFVFIITHMPPLFSFIMLLIITISVASFFFPQIIPNFAAMKEKIKRIKQQKLEEKLRLEEQKSAILQEELNRKKLEKELKELESNIPKKKGCLAIIWDLIFGVLAAIAVIVTIIIILDYFKMI